MNSPLTNEGTLALQNLLEMREEVLTGPTGTDLDDKRRQGDVASKPKRARDSYLNKETVRQNLYVYAVNRGNNSRALTERWNIVLDSSVANERRSSRRKSLMTGVEAP